VGSGFERQAPHRDIGTPSMAPTWNYVICEGTDRRLAARGCGCSLPWPVGVAAVGNRQDGNGALPVVDGVQGAIVAAPG
jgi:hypothetical protein